MSNRPMKIPDQLLKRAKDLSSTLLSDAMDRMGSMDYRVKPRSNQPKLIGTAFTVSLKPGDNLFLHQAIYTAEQGDVLVVDGKEDTQNAYLGELMALIAKERNLNGIVIDGLIRDKEIIEQLDFPIFAKGFIPNGPFKKGPGELNKQISCGGVAVNPGDLVVGDLDGVVIVPRENLDEVFKRAEEKLAYEKQTIEKINQYQRAKAHDSNAELTPPAWLSEMMKP